MKVVVGDAAVGVGKDLLQGALEHRRGGAHRVVPVDVPVHLVVREHQRLDRGDPLAGDRQAPPPRVVLDRRYQPVPVYAFPERDAAEQGVPQEIVDLVRIEGAAENVGQEQVAGGDLAVLGLVIDCVRHSARIDAELLPQNPADAAGFVLDDPAGVLFVVDEERHQLLEGMGKGIVPDVVKQGGGEKDADILVRQLERGIGPDQTGEKLLGEVVDAERMLEAGVARSRVDEVDEPELGDVAKALELLGVDQGEEWFGSVDVPPDRVADGFALFFQPGMSHRAQSIEPP